MNSNQQIKDPNNIWSNFHIDLVAGIKSFSHCIALADIMSDGDNRLICADLTCSLKVFKSQVLQNESKLHFTPVALVSFYAPDTNTKNCVPYLAVAGGAYIFIYKNMKGTFKFCIPNPEVNADEIQVWNDLKENRLDVPTAVKRLTDLKNTSKMSITLR
jgi:hypothetical protein